jgi:hypothetical protein
MNRIQIRIRIRKSTTLISINLNSVYRNRYCKYENLKESLEMIDKCHYGTDSDKGFYIYFCAILTV